MHLVLQWETFFTPSGEFKFCLEAKNVCVIFLAALGNKTQHQLQLPADISASVFFVVPIVVYFW